ncbi:concanavalin A-like lectin/glucanase [Lojkania enalia]|uniref:chitinase n=1 Tax=Lojkania enalia TaxID=147567 RepID=A0A9P4JYA9_9PLEO|nr:concanavalin A-like lectin/glucanase [Didymosphaeria enalia]
MRFSYLPALGLAGFTVAQTFTDCNPMEKDCPNDPAMSKNFDTSFTAGAANVKGWKQTAGALTYGKEGAQFTINKQGDAPTIQSEGYVFFGYVEVKMKASPGQGIISSIVLQSEDLDEVDWEFLGGFDSKVQMNYFGKGNTTTYDRMIEAPVANAQQQFHTYALNWTSSSLIYLIDGQPVRTLNYADANGGKNYPQTPSTVRIGIWAGGDENNEPGVIEWAGGKTDYSKAPFTMTVASVKVINYNPGTEYKWADKSGSFESIEVIGKDNEAGAPQNSQVLTPSATATGGLLQSEINIPTNTGGQFAPYPTISASESCGKDYPSSTGAPQPSNGTDCSCGIATVTVTGTPPPETPAITLQSSALPVESSSVTFIAPPASSLPPYPTSGLITETAPAPSVPLPTGTGVPAVPTTSSPVEFPGAAASIKGAGAMFGLVAGVMLFAF